MRIAVSSIGAKVPLLREVKKAINRNGGGVLIGIDRDPDCVGRRFVDYFYTDIKKVIYDFLIPTRDAELEWIGKYKAVVSEDIIRFSDKYEFSQLCGSLGIKHPKTSLDRETFSKPCIEKARHGAGTIDMRVVYTHSFMAVKKDSEMIYQEHIAGIEYTCDAYFTNQGKLHGFILRSRDSVKNGESVITTVSTDETLKALCSDYLQRFGGLRGHINMQLIGDTVIEINPRVGGASSCSFTAGLNSIDWMILEYQGKELPPLVERVIRQVRYKCDMIEWL